MRIEKTRPALKWAVRAQFVEKVLLFHKVCAYLKWKRGLAPFFKPFPLAG